MRSNLAQAKHAVHSPETSLLTAPITVVARRADDDHRARIPWCTQRPLDAEAWAYSGDERVGAAVDDGALVVASGHGRRSGLTQPV